LSYFVCETGRGRVLSRYSPVSVTEGKKHRVLCESYGQNAQFLGACAKLRKVTISFVMSVCPPVRPSVRKEQLGSHWTHFYEI